MIDSIASSTVKFRRFLREFPETEAEVRTREKKAKSDDLSKGYWPEGRLYFSEEVKKKKTARKAPELDFVVPWQMRQDV